MSLKENLLCGICSKILKKPVGVPCNCSQICKEDVDKEIKNKNHTMTCPTCKESYDIPENGYLGHSESGKCTANFAKESSLE
jgi:hypothetical protein